MLDVNAFEAGSNGGGGGGISVKQLALQHHKVNQT
jgi:hypothetical protein